MPFGTGDAAAEPQSRFTGDCLCAEGVPGASSVANSSSSPVSTSLGILILRGLPTDLGFDGESLIARGLPTLPFDLLDLADVGVFLGEGDARRAFSSLSHIVPLKAASLIAGRGLLRDPAAGDCAWFLAGLVVGLLAALVLS